MFVVSKQKHKSKICDVNYFIVWNKMITFYSCCLLSNNISLAGAQVEIEEKIIINSQSSMNNKSLNITSFFISTFSPHRTDFEIDLMPDTHKCFGKITLKGLGQSSVEDCLLINCTKAAALQVRSWPPWRKGSYHGSLKLYVNLGYREPRGNLPHSDPLSKPLLWALTEEPISLPKW